MKPMFRRIWGLMYRHLALYRRSWPRLLELSYWPILQMCIWGFTARFLASRMGSSGMMAGAALLGGVLLWEVTLRSQMGMSLSFLEEVWSRNLGHLFVSPLRPFELIAALIGMSIIRMLLGVMPAILLAWGLYAFNLFSVGPILVLFFINLMIMGWSVALGVVSLVLRRGGAAGLGRAVRPGAVLRRVLPRVGPALVRAAALLRAADNPRVRRDARGPAAGGNPLGPSGCRFRIERDMAGRRRTAVHAAIPRRPRQRCADKHW